MNVKECIIRKNEIVFKATDIILVPEDQIVDNLPAMPLKADTDTHACPYCWEFYISSWGHMCRGCPMYEADNECSRAGSTYNTVVDILKSSIVTSVVGKEIEELITEYNKSNGFAT